jgi:hypothetical protein
MEQHKPVAFETTRDRDARLKRRERRRRRQSLTRRV